jgi:membrane protein required for beta-lactamase induction
MAPTVRNRASVPNLVMSVVAFLVFMALLLQVVGGFGIGTPEMLVWVVILVVGLVLIVGRYRAASRPQG